MCANQPSRRQRVRQPIPGFPAVPGVPSAPTWPAVATKPPGPPATPPVPAAPPVPNAPPLPTTPPAPVPPALPKSLLRRRQRRRFHPFRRHHRCPPIVTVLAVPEKVEANPPAPPTPPSAPAPPLPGAAATPGCVHRPSTNLDGLAVGGGSRTGKPNAHNTFGASAITPALTRQRLGRDHAMRGPAFDDSYWRLRDYVLAGYADAPRAASKRRVSA